MADSVRIKRVSEQIRAELSQILRDEIRDPRIGMLTVTRVKLASDLGFATVFYSPLGEELSEARAAEIAKAMASVAGYARKQIARRVKLRHTPELRFVLDDSIVVGSKTLSLIRKLEIQPEEQDGETDSDAEPELGEAAEPTGDSERELS